MWLALRWKWKRNRKNFSITENYYYFYHHHRDRHHNNNFSLGTTTRPVTGDERGTEPKVNSFILTSLVFSFLFDPTSEWIECLMNFFLLSLSLSLSILFHPFTLSPSSEGGRRRIKIHFHSEKSTNIEFAFEKKKL